MSTGENAYFLEQYCNNALKACNWPASVEGRITPWDPSPPRSQGVCVATPTGVMSTRRNRSDCYFDDKDKCNDHVARFDYLFKFVFGPVGNRNAGGTQHN
ncbi:hypothetical protein N7507_011736 [Penicillium longicatenatum]|nr:hypothetical protein N7507_011736 [Penicillium longicatenatum]